MNGVLSIGRMGVGQSHLGGHAFVSSVEGRKIVDSTLRVWEGAGAERSGGACAECRVWSLAPVLVLCALMLPVARVDIQRVPTQPSGRHGEPFARVRA